MNTEWFLSSRNSQSRKGGKYINRSLLKQVVVLTKYEQSTEEELAQPVGGTGGWKKILKQKARVLMGLDGQVGVCLVKKLR